MTAPGGRLVLMGNPDGPRTLSQDLYWQILRKQLTVMGTWNSSYGGPDSDWTEAVQAIAAGCLQTDAIVTHVLSQAELDNGLGIMKNRKKPFCKILLEWSK